MTVVVDCVVISSSFKQLSIFMLNVVITLLLAKESKTAHEISLQLRCTKQTLPGPFGSLFKNDGQSKTNKINYNLLKLMVMRIFLLTVNII